MQVYNMDKIPMPYMPHHKYTFAKKGLKLVKATRLSSGVKVMTALIVSNLGYKLFFGKQTGRENHCNNSKTSCSLYPQDKIKRMVSKKVGMDTTINHSQLLLDKK